MTLLRFLLKGNKELIVQPMTETDINQIFDQWTHSLASNTVVMFRGTCKLSGCKWIVRSDAIEAIHTVEQPEGQQGQPQMTNPYWRGKSGMN